jgi:hypothetical protein
MTCSLPAELNPLRTMRANDAISEMALLLMQLWTARAQLMVEEIQPMAMKTAARGN